MSEVATDFDPYFNSCGKDQVIACNYPGERWVICSQSYLPSGEKLRAEFIKLASELEVAELVLKGKGPASNDDIYWAKETIRKDVPVWDKEKGELRFRGVIVRHVKPAAKNIRALLDKAQESNWVNPIGNPWATLTGVGQQEQGWYRAALVSLNDGLRLISFHADGTTLGFTWESLPSLPTSPQINRKNSPPSEDENSRINW